MYNKVQFTVKDLNTMYAAGIMHTRESLGFGSNFKKAGVETLGGDKDKPAAKAKDSVTDLTTDNTVVTDIMDVLKKHNSSKNASSDVTTNPDGNASSNSTSGATASLMSGKAKDGVAAKADFGKIGMVAKGAGTLGGGPVLGAILGGLVSFAQSQQQRANNEEARLQQKDWMDTMQRNDLQDKLNEATDPNSLISILSENYDGTTISSNPDDAATNDAESRSNSQGF